MIKARYFILIAVAIFGTLLIWNVVQRGYTYKNKGVKRALEFRFVKEEKPFVVIIPSYNNEDYVEKNLRSVLEQEYNNYRVIYVDDCSTDRTYEAALECVRAFEAEDKVTFIRNRENYKALYNLYYAIQTIPDDEIVVILDGDDWAAHSGVLKELNRYYADPNVWICYSQFITYPKYEKGNMLPVNVNKRTLRGQTFLPQIRSFYAGLFKKIKLKDLLYQGEFFPSSWDLAIMLPLWEMGRHHSVFIPDVLYVYNRESPLNDDKIHREKQALFKRYIRSLPPYSEIQGYLGVEGKEESSALVIFSENRPLQLLSFLESLKKSEKQFSPVHIFYSFENEEIEKGYQIVKEEFHEDVLFHLWTDGEALSQIIQSIEESYITFAKDTLILSRNIDLEEAIQTLEKTGAYALYFDLGLNISEIPAKVLPIGEGTVVIGLI